MKRKGESLDSYLTRKIVEMDGVEPEDVTVEYIRQQREKKIYPNTRYDVPEGLISLTRNEWNRLEAHVDEIMKRLTN